MKEALKELRKIIQIPDQKYWNCMEMRERALEEWIERWIVAIKREQSALNYNKMPLDVQDLLKEQLISNILDELMTDAATITTNPTKITGELVCLRRKAKE
jgi:hypothetical protein